MISFKMRAVMWIVILCLPGVQVRRQGDKALKDVHKMINFDPDYNVHQYPKPREGPDPLRVGFQINLRNVLEVNEVSQTCSLETTIRMYWRDWRVSILSNASLDGLNYVTLNPRAASLFWIPDIFIDQAKDLRSPTYFTRPASLRVYNDSVLRFAARVNFDVACPMTFYNYPKDVQECIIKLESFGFTSKQIEFLWMSGSNINENISLPQFSLKVKVGDEYRTDYYDLDYPGVILRLILSRKMSFHIIQTYIPSSIFVILAWLTTFLSPDQTAARVTMSMTTLLTLTAMFGAIRTEVPRVSYISMLDIWMLVCVLFVFSTIIQFILASCFARKQWKTASILLDLFTGLLLPLLFGLFNYFYWTSFNQ